MITIDEFEDLSKENFKKPPNEEITEEDLLELSTSQTCEDEDYTGD